MITHTNISKIFENNTQKQKTKKCSCPRTIREHIFPRTIREHAYFSNKYQCSLIVLAPFSTENNPGTIENIRPRTVLLYKH